jgi:flagellar motor switch protein FliM
MMASCDRTMAFAIADLGFGGTGDEPPFVSVERPLSATEAGLVKLLLDRLLEELPLIVATSFDLTSKSANGPQGSDSPDGEQAQRHVVFRLLVNVLGYDGEVKIGLNREQLLHLASGCVDGKSASTAGASVDTISGGVAASSADLLVSLGDETLTVEALMALAPGQLLPLRSTVHAPVQVWSGGIRLFPARLMRTGNYLAVRIGE